VDPSDVSKEQTGIRPAIAGKICLTVKLDQPVIRASGTEVLRSLVQPAGSANNQWQSDRYIFPNRNASAK